MEAVAEREVSAQLAAARKLEEAAKFLDLEPWIVRRLRQCEREVTVNLEVICDNGEPMMFRGVRVQHSAVRGPYMGPLMFARDMSSGDMQALAASLTWQSALWDLPFGGSAGWIGASLEELSEREARLLTRAYVESMRGVIGANTDVITPKRNGHRQVSAWALGAIGKANRDQSSAVTGKPASLGGVAREKIAALFLRGLLAAALREQEMKLSGAKVAIAGFGDEARCIASAIESAGACVVAVCDRSGAVFHRSRIEIGNLLQYVQNEDVVFGYPDAQAISGEEMMELPVDILALMPGYDLPGVTEARIVVEAGGRASGAMGKGAMVIPALLADAGLLIADCLEWRMSACGVLSERELLRGMQGLVRKTWSEVWEHSRRCEISPEQSAMAIAVGRVAQAMRMG